MSTQCGYFDQHALPQFKRGVDPSLCLACVFPWDLVYRCDRHVTMCCKAHATFVLIASKCANTRRCYTPLQSPSIIQDSRPQRHSKSVIVRPTARAALSSASPRAPGGSAASPPRCCSGSRWPPAVKARVSTAVAQKSEEDGVAYLVAALDLAGVRLGAVDLAALVHVVEALLGARAGLLGVVGVGDGGLCMT